MICRSIQVMLITSLHKAHIRRVQIDFYALASLSFFKNKPYTIPYSIFFK